MSKAITIMVEERTQLLTRQEKLREDLELYTSARTSTREALSADAAEIAALNAAINALGGEPKKAVRERVKAVVRKSA